MIKKLVIFSFIAVLGLYTKAMADSPVSGSILLDTRAQTNNGDVTREEYRLTLKASKRTHDIYAYGEVWLRGFGVTQSATYLPQLQQYSSAPPTYLDVRQVYVEFYQFLTENLDLKIGKQLLSWGTADGVNPTNNINPYDFEDPFKVNNRLPVPMLVAEYYLPHEISVTGVIEPIFVPSVLPSDRWVSAFQPSIPIPSWLPIGKINLDLSMPQQSFPDSISYAVRIAKKALLGYDFSLSYYNGLYSFPVLSSANITTSANNIIANIGLDFPRFSIIGGDFAGSIGDHGIWGEVALNIPQQPLQFNAYILGNHVQSETMNIATKPFVKYIIGTDYSFENGIYLNVQYLHGQSYEIGDQLEGYMLEDYLLFDTYRNFFYDKLKVQLAGMFELAHQNKTGYMFIPQIDWMPYDNLITSIGAYIFTGNSSTHLGSVKDNSEAFIKVSYTF